jgi:hypothetical protein
MNAKCALLTRHSSHVVWPLCGPAVPVRPAGSLGVTAATMLVVDTV